jgi:hypothetical protein
MQQLGETGVALATLVTNFAHIPFASLTTCYQAIAVQTFVLTKWEIPSQDHINIVVSICIVFQWLFVILFVGIAFGIHTHEGTEYYATPTPVRNTSLVDI